MRGGGFEGAPRGVRLAEIKIIPPQFGFKRIRLGRAA